MVLLRTFLSAPNGWNFRNEALHGFVDDVGWPGAGLVLITVLYLTLLRQHRESTKPDRLATKPCNSQLCTMHAVSATSNARVSHRGQTCLPAELRHRWGIDEGGEVGFIDLGDAALIVPGGVTAARRELRRVLADRYEVGLAALADPELADQ